MTHADLDDADLHGFIDNELPAARMQEVAALIAGNPELAAEVVAFRADKERLRAAFAPVADQALPAAWLRRIDAAERVQPDMATLRPVSHWRAIAAALVLGAVLSAGGWIVAHPDGAFLGDPIVSAARAAHNGTASPALSLRGAALPHGEAGDSVLQAALGMRLHAPDLSRLGYQLAAIETFGTTPGRDAVDLVYRDGQARRVTVYLRHSPGAARFDMLRRGPTRICIWQDDVISIVMMGDIPAGEMMRLASRAYSELNS